MWKVNQQVAIARLLFPVCLEIFLMLLSPPINSNAQVSSVQFPRSSRIAESRPHLPHLPSLVSPAGKATDSVNQGETADDVDAKAKALNQPASRRTAEVVS